MGKRQQQNRGGEQSPPTGEQQPEQPESAASNEQASAEPPVDASADTNGDDSQAKAPEAPPPPDPPAPPNPPDDELLNELRQLARRFRMPNDDVEELLNAARQSSAEECREQIEQGRARLKDRDERRAEERAAVRAKRHGKRTAGTYRVMGPGSITVRGRQYVAGTEVKLSAHDAQSLESVELEQLD